MAGIIEKIKKGWEQARDLRSPEGFAKNLSLLYDDIDGQETMARTLAARSGEEYQSNPIEEWDRKIEMMMTSHDPRIQKLGIDLMDDQYNRETSQQAANVPNSFREYQYATPEEEQSHEGYNNWLQQRSTQRVMNVQDPNAPVPLNELDGMQDADGNPMPFPVGTTWQQVKDAGAQVGGAKLSSEEGRREGQFAIAAENLDSLEAAMEAGADLSGLGGQLKAARSEGGWTGSVLNAAMDTIGFNNMSPADIEAIGLVSSIENTIVAAIRGAAVGPKEIDQFARQLPRAGMPPDQFKANLEQTRRNLAILEARSRAMRGVKSDDSDLSEKEIRNLMYQTFDEADAPDPNPDLTSLVPSRLLQNNLPVGAVPAPDDVFFGDQ